MSSGLSKATAALVCAGWITGSGCIPMKTKHIPMANPAAGREPAAELRLATKDERLAKDCERQHAIDCLDVFWRLERVTPERIVFRLRVVSPDEKGARAQTSYTDQIHLVTPDGRSVRATLLDEHTLEVLPPMSYKDDGWAPTGNKIKKYDESGNVYYEDQMGTTTETKQLVRYSGNNYVGFDGKALIDASTPWVKLTFPKGLLGGGAEWTFDFKSSTIDNAVIASEREPSRPL